MRFFKTHGRAKVLQQPVSTGSRSKMWTTMESKVAQVPSWPDEARTLKKHTWIRYVYMLGDFLLVLLPLYFILLGVAVITLHGKPTKNNAFGEKVEIAIQLGPTIFPIMFAAICGRSMKMIARYIAERRAKLCTLELLMASQSVWGTIESQFLMQRLTLVGANLLFLWTLSPLGGQASLRLMTRGDTRTLNSTTLRYMSSGPGSVILGLQTTYSDNGKFADAAALYNAALVAPISTKLSPQDPWGNVKVPQLDQYDNSSSEWQDVPMNGKSAETYSSLVGIPVVGLPLNGRSSFTLENTYLKVDCTPFNVTFIPKNEEGDGYENWPLIEKIVPGQIWSNKSQFDNNPFGYRKSGGEVEKASFFIDTDRPTYNPYGEDVLETTAYMQRFDASLGSTNISLLGDGKSPLQEPRNLLYASKYPSDFENESYRADKYNLAVTKCALTQVHVEVMVECSGTSCAANKLRKSLSDKRSPNFTGLEHVRMMHEFVKRFPFAVSPGFGSSSTERFLANSSDYLFPRKNQHSVDRIEDGWVDLTKISKEVFSKRLGLLLSTYYQLTIQPTGYWGNLSPNLSSYGPDVLPVNDLNHYLPSSMTISNSTTADWYGDTSVNMMNMTAPFIGATAGSNVTSTEQIFVCQFAWLSLLITCSSTILLTGFAALIMKRRTLGPELFGFVTSMTYENPYIRIPAGGSTLDAMERAKLLRDVEVCVGDVHGDQATGHIALSAGVPARKLERGRLYA
ncbi:hypothetical protein DM02DRAFT_657891 [Periconia macrospinosa]|uniref:Uncharacterized protein n=1 Tax=Periconia macrospinosa TaxID=97972 RepID=A0A2V1DI67_9PLEO|nr:hypothetical protein DM02DRAFT_657891 [Periconia macrospinosa]